MDDEQSSSPMACSMFCVVTTMLNRLHSWTGLQSTQVRSVFVEDTNFELSLSLKAERGREPDAICPKVNPGGVMLVESGIYPPVQLWHISL